MSQAKKRKKEKMSLRDQCDPNKQIERLCREVEPIAVVHKRKEEHHGHVTNPRYRLTYKAELAKRGYLVQSTLGSGSYSKVKMAINVHATHVKTADKVAVKIIDRLKAPRDYQEKFLPRELDVWPRLTHPNIAVLHEFFQDTRRVYMVLEYAERGDVLKYIQATGALGEVVARKWIIQLADAIRYMHEMEITHRDLKLENLLIDSAGNMKICDFGFVKDFSSAIHSQTYCGSKSYAAPEILMGKPYDPKKSDVWAIGVILYIFVTGKMPFDETKGTKSILQEQRNLAFRWSKHRKITDSCKQLIVFTFTWDFYHRPDIHRILNDSWFKQPPSLTDIKDDDAQCSHQDKDSMQDGLLFSPPAGQSEKRHVSSDAKVYHTASS